MGKKARDAWTQVCRAGVLGALPRSPGSRAVSVGHEGV